MSRTARLWRGAGFLMLGGLMLPGGSAFAGDDPPLSKQLTDLGRQALDQGAAPTAETFFQRALLLDPNNKTAAQGLEQSKQARGKVVQVAMQQPGTPPAAPVPPEPGVSPDAPLPGPADSRATIDQTLAAENLARQQLTHDVEQRLQAARQLMDSGQPEAALNQLRLNLNVVRSAVNVPDADRADLERRIQAQMISTAQAEDRIVAERAESQRLEAATEQRTRAIDIFQRNKETIGAMMVQFDTLMSEGVYNILFIGGLGDIRAAAQPFYEARLLAQKAYALQRGGPLPYSDNDPAPAAGELVSNAMSFYTQELMFVRLKNYRFLLTMQDVTRASIPFPDNQFIEYPDADWWRYISEKRIKRWGRAVDLFERDPKHPPDPREARRAHQHVVRRPRPRSTTC